MRGYSGINTGMQRDHDRGGQGRRRNEEKSFSFVKMSSRRKFSMSKKPEDPHRINEEPKKLLPFSLFSDPRELTNLTQIKSILKTLFDSDVSSSSNEEQKIGNKCLFGTFSAMQGGLWTTIRLKDKRRDTIPVRIRNQRARDSQVV